MRGDDTTGWPGCRARPGPVLAVEAFLDEHPGAYRPDELAAALAGDLEPLAVAEVVAYLLGAGRAALDEEGCLVRPGLASGGRGIAAGFAGDHDDPLSWMSANDHPDGVR